MSEETRYQRRLSTIIAVDVCRYAHLVEQNEDRAIRSVDACRRLIADIVDAHGGRIFNHAGDGVMAETPSAVEGVRAAFQIHRALRAHNADHPEDPPLSVRIGVNLGDVVAKDDGDLVGHGVNIAARLESIAAPGETVISHAVYEQVRGAVEELFQAAGYEKLKNIDAPVAVYRAHQGGPGKKSPLAALAGWRRPRRMLIPVAALALALAGMVAVVLLRAPQRDTASPAVAARTIAVLPFANIGQNPDNAFVADGITEEILSALMRLDDITVMGRTSAYLLGDNADSVAEMTERYGITHRLEGSVRRDGDRVRITAQLIDARSGAQLWSETYGRDLGDVFALQQDIADAVATAMEVRLQPATAADLHAVDSVTYELYLRGRDLLNQRGASLPQAISLFETVVARDPDFADGWAALASASHVLPGYSNTPYTSVDRIVEQAANQALRVNPNSAEALAVLAARDRKAGAWQQADAGFRKALALEPNNLSAIYYYAEFLLSVGRIREAGALFDRAYAIDPLSPFTSTGVGWARYFGGDSTGAEEAFRRAWDDYGMRLTTVWEGLFTLLLDKGRFDEAMAYIASYPGDPAVKSLYAGFVQTLTNTGGDSRAALNALFDAAAGNGPIPYYWRYEAFARLGLVGDALDIAARAAAAGPLETTQPLFSPSADAVWKDPAFGDVATTLGLLTYWQEVAPPDLCSAAPRPDYCP